MFHFVSLSNSYITAAFSPRLFFQRIPRSGKRNQKLNLELSFETEFSKRKFFGCLKTFLSCLHLQSQERNQILSLLRLISISTTPILWHYFSNRSIFLNLNETASRLKSVFKTCSTR